jgi:hypothetical protein
MIITASNPIIKNINISEIKSLVLSNISNAGSLKDLPPELIASMGTLITILKAAGIIFIIYLIFLTASSIMAIIRNKRIKKIYESVNEINNKLDILLKKNKRKK